MRPTRHAALALALGGLSALAQAEPVSQDFVALTLRTTSDQAQASGFLDGQRLSGSTRNWYAHEHATRGPLWSYSKRDGSRHPTSSRDNWVQGTLLNYTSGFTEGTVGLSTEVALYNAVALQRGRASVAGPNNRTSPTATARCSTSGARSAWPTSRPGCPTPPSPPAASPSTPR